MPKFIVTVMGESEIIEAKNRAAAENWAYETWLDSVDQDYCAEEYTPELAKEYGLKEDEKGEEESDASEA